MEMCLHNLFRCGQRFVFHGRLLTAPGKISARACFVGKLTPRCPARKRGWGTFDSCAGSRLRVAGYASQSGPTDNWRVDGGRSTPLKTNCDSNKKRMFMTPETVDRHLLLNGSRVSKLFFFQQSEWSRPDGQRVKKPQRGTCETGWRGSNGNQPVRSTASMNLHVSDQIRPRQC